MSSVTIAERIEHLFKQTVDRTGGEWGLVFKDLDSDLTVALNPDRVFASASLIKLPVLISAMIAASDGSIDLSTRLELDHSEISEEDRDGSGVIIHLSNPVSLTIRDLCVLMIITSDNFATNAIIDLLGMSYINGILQRLGLRDTRINHRIADFEQLKDVNTNPITAGEVSQLLEAVYTRQLPHSSTIEEILQKQIYGTRIPLLLPYEDDDLLVAHKTGTLRTIAHDAGILRTSKGAYVLCILTQQQEAIARTNLAMAELAAEIYGLLIAR